MAAQLDVDVPELPMFEALHRRLARRGDPPASTAWGSRHRVVVVGGGFAGLQVVKGLADVPVDVLLVDRNAYSTFQPLLYQVATGGLNPGDVTQSQRAFAGRFDNVRFRQADMLGLDTGQRLVEVNWGAPIAYDTLVLCVGGAANHFGVPGAAEHSHSIYGRTSSVRLRNVLFSSLEAVAQGRPAAPDPVVVIVGAGATGVELAGMLAELKEALPLTHPEVDPDRVRIVLVEMTEEVLATFKPSLREYTKQELYERGVELRLGTAVEEVAVDGVRLSDGEWLSAAATVWTSGITVEDRVANWGLPTREDGRIQVDPDLRVTGHDHVYAIGDVAGTAVDPLPQLAQPAMDGGEHVAEQVTRQLQGLSTQPLRFRSKGTMATIGRAAAIVELPQGIDLTGSVAWLTWVGLHIAELMGPRHRVATLVNLAARYITARGHTNVIVGDPHPWQAAGVDGGGTEHETSPP